jgi:hypothetical protein
MYADVSVIVDGALGESETFTDYLLLEEYVRTIEEEAAGHGYPWPRFTSWSITTR